MLLSPATGMPRLAHTDEGHLSKLHPLVQSIYRLHPLVQSTGNEKFQNAGHSISANTKFEQENAGLTLQMRVT